MSTGTLANSFSCLERGVPECVEGYLQKFFEFFSCLFDPLGICRVNDVDEGVGVGEVVAPVLSESLLAADVPDVELEFIMSKVLDVEALGGSDGGDVLNTLFGT